MTDKDLITKLVSFTEVALVDFVRNNADYVATAVAFNMDAANNLVNISLTRETNRKESYDKYDEVAQLKENLIRGKKAGWWLSTLPFKLEELWEKPNVATIELLPEEQLAETTGDKRVKLFYKICNKAMSDFMKTDTFDELIRKEQTRTFFNVINKGDSLDIATDQMREALK